MAAPLTLEAGVLELANAIAADIKAVVSKKDIARNIMKYGAVGDGIADDTAAFMAAHTDAAGEGVYLPAGKRFLVRDAQPTGDVFIYGPGVLVQGLGSPLIRAILNWDAPIGVDTVDKTVWGANDLQGSQRLSRIKITGAGYNRFSAGDAYSISANEVYSWNAASGGGDTFAQVKAGLWTINGIGLEVSSITNGGPLEGLRVQGMTSGSSGLVQAAISQSATDSRVIFASVTGDFTSGEILTVVAGGSTAVAAGTAIGTAGAMCLLKAGKPFDDTYTTSIQIRKIDKSKRCLIDANVDAAGDTNGYYTAAQRKDAILVTGYYRPYVKLRVTNGYCRALMLKSCYFGTYDVTVNGLPNHTGADQGAFGYGVSLSGATEGTVGVINVEQLRHGFTTNVNYTATWSTDGFVNGFNKYHEWGTAKYNTVSGQAMNCTNAGFDCHPGAMYTRFLNARVVVHSPTGRTASTHLVGFTSRGIGTIFENCLGEGCGFNDDGSSLAAGIYHQIVVKNCRTIDAPQYGFSQLYDSGLDANGVPWATVLIEDCDFGMDGTAAPYTKQRPILLAKSWTRVRNTRVSRFNNAPVYIKTSSVGGTYEFLSFIADYTSYSGDAASTTPFQIDGTVDLFIDYTIKASTVGPPALFESVSGGTNILLLDVKRISKNNLPPILLNTSGSGNVTNGAYGARRSGTLSDANTTVVPKTHAQTLVCSVPITADRLVTFPQSSAAINGDEFDVVRTTASTGAFSLLIRNGSTTLVKLQPGQSCTVKYNGTDWVLIRSSAFLNSDGTVPGTTTTDSNDYLAIYRARKAA